MGLAWLCQLPGFALCSHLPPAQAGAALSSQPHAWEVGSLDGGPELCRRGRWGQEGLRWSWGRSPGQWDRVGDVTVPACRTGRRPSAHATLLSPLVKRPLLPESLQGSRRRAGALSREVGNRLLPLGRCTSRRRVCPPAHSRADRVLGGVRGRCPFIRSCVERLLEPR